MQKLTDRRPVFSASETKRFPEGAWDILNARLTEQRRERILSSVARRSAWVRLVIQDVHDPHNISACLRSAEAFGIQCIDVVNLRHKYRTSGVARGSDRWLSLRMWQEIAPCAKALKAEGYRIAVGYPATESVTLPSLPVNEPIAVVFGNEHAGVDAAWQEFIDYKFTIPMVGMVESLNISVSAAVTLFTLRQRVEQTLDAATYLLNETERNQLLDRWICQQTPQYELELKHRKLRGDAESQGS